MRKSKKLSLSRESLCQLENGDISEVRGGALTKFGTLCHSCHNGCANYTLFGSCTC